MSHGARTAVSRRPCPAHVPERDLVPKESAEQGFSGRAPAVTQEQLRAVDDAVNAAKATPGYRAASDHFQLEQQNRGEL